MPLFKIQHRISGTVLFKGDFGSLKLCLEAGIKSGDCLRGANLGNADLRNAGLGGADLGGADLGGADLRNADLGNAHLRHAYLGGADLGGANLGNAHLGNADLRNADLGGANLRHANLRGADLRNADLGGAHLRHADLGEADLRGAYLGNAHLGNADLGGAKGIQPERCTPLLILQDQPGKIRAYKLVNRANTGPYRGGISYEIGKSYAVTDANDNPAAQCGAGINLATLDWCMGAWQEGYRILVAEFTAKDIAAIPTATDGKFRVRKCKIVAEKDLVQLGLIKAMPAETEAA